MASDNRATEKLCKLLDERGIKWKDGDASYEIEWSTPDGRHCSAMYWKPTFTVLVSGCTPEQAIAVTLGSCTLTAEDVRSFLSRHSRFDDATWMHGSQELVFDEGDLQAMADELNAKLGSGTCEQVLADCDDGLMPPFTAHCGACGAEWGFTPKYCHNCGAKVVGVRDERKKVER